MTETVLDAVAGTGRLARERRLLDHVSRAVEDVFDSVEALCPAMLSIVDDASTGKRSVRRGDLLGLRPVVADILARHAGLVAGAGVVMAPDVLEDAPLWIEWCWLNSESALEQLHADLDPHSAEFYDYTTNEWYREPRRTRKRHIAGPYVDYICTHEYTFTLSTPLIHRGRFLGVAGADILASQVEHMVMPGLAQLPCVAALASGNGRVISSNSSRLIPGMLLPRRPADGALQPVVEPGSAPGHVRLPWTLLEGTALEPPQAAVV